MRNAAPPETISLLDSSEFDIAECADTQKGLKTILQVGTEVEEIAPILP